MNQGPLFSRKFFLQAPVGHVPTVDAGTACLYVRVSGSTANPGKVLQGQRVVLAPGGVLDVVSDAHGGTGVGNVAYTRGLVAGLKRGASHFVYRFEVPATTTAGTTYEVAVHGTDAVPAFRFVLEIGPTS